MATTHTITSPRAGDRLYKFTALADSESFDINAGGAKRIFFQVPTGTFNSSTVKLQGSLDGVTFTDLYPVYSYATIGPATGLTLPGSVAATAVSQAILEVQMVPHIRITVSGGTGTGIAVNILLTTL